MHVHAWHMCPSPLPPLKCVCVDSVRCSAVRWRAVRCGAGIALERSPYVKFFAVAVLICMWICVSYACVHSESASKGERVRGAEWGAGAGRTAVQCMLGGRGWVGEGGAARMARAQRWTGAHCDLRPECRAGAGSGAGAGLRKPHAHRSVQQVTDRVCLMPACLPAVFESVYIRPRPLTVPHVSLLFAIVFAVDR